MYLWCYHLSFWVTLQCIIQKDMNQPDDEAGTKLTLSNRFSTDYAPFRNLVKVSWDEYITYGCEL